MKKIITVFSFFAAFILCGSSAMAVPGSGSAVVVPSSDVVAGTAGKWTFTYTASENFLTGTVHLVIPTGWSAPQISNGAAAGYITVTSEGVLEATPVTIDGRTVRVSVNTLIAGQTVDIVYGDDSVSSSGNAAAQPAVETGVEFTVRSNPVGNSPADIAASPSLNVIASDISQLIFITAPAGFTAGSESGVMRVAARDQYGTPQVVAADPAVDLSSESGTGSFSALPGPGWSAVTSVTISAGEDTASFYYRDTTAGAHNITASGAAQSWTDAVQQVDVTAGAPARLEVSPQDSTIVAGDYARFLVEVTDVYGNRSVLPVNQTISLLSTSGNSFYDKDDHGLNVATLVIPSGASSAEVDFMHTAMNLTTGYLVAFLDMDGIPPSLESTATNIYIDHSVASAASSQVAVDKYSVTADGVDQVTVSVTSMDQYGNPVNGTAISLLATDSGGGNQITQPSGTTGSDGLAVGTVRSTVAETKTIRATIDGAEVADTEDVVFIAGPASLTLSEISADMDTVTADGTDEALVTVVVRDAFGNAVPGGTVVLEMSGSGNSITQPVGVTGANGVATGTVRSTVAEAKTVRARIDGSYMTDDVDLVFMAGSASLTLSEISADKVTVTADGVDEALMTVIVRDAQGNTVPGRTVTLEMSGSGNSITQPVGVTGANGVATGTVRSTVAEEKTVRARIDGSYMTDEVDLTYVAGPVSLVVSGITSDTDTVTADGVDEALVTVVVRDAQGNTVPGRAVVLEMSGSGNSITQPVGVTGADGVATGTVRSTVAEAKTVRARIDGSYMTGDLDLTYVAGAASLTLSEITADKVIVTADGVDEALMTVVVRDAQGNTVPGRAVVLEMSGSGNSITQPVGVTGANGVATGTVRSTVAEAKTVRARIDGSLITDDVDLTYVAGPVSLVVSGITSDTDTVTADGTDEATITVVVRDAQGNTISGSVVSLEMSGSGNSLTQPVGVTGANGVATGTVRSTVAEEKTVRARIDGSLITNDVDLV
ncbi:MAG: Ig-like domain-containing protein, partial [Candidatus Krumholzibacteria bacterium]|nr:Ig-like domain-containing protein [Candidatus Krumholzibacteria bacterium]